jgi:starvation-inducible DNA-binding protein
LYFKLHNLHWNVIGPQFKDVHLYLEELYNEYATKLDDVAECLKQVNEFPIGSMHKSLSLATLNELEDKDYNVMKVVDILLSDFSHLKHLAQEIRYMSLEDDNYPIVNMMEDHLTGYSKTMWFLFSMQK